MSVNMDRKRNGGAEQAYIRFVGACVPPADLVQARRPSNEHEVVACDGSQEEAIADENMVIAWVGDRVEKTRG